MLSVLREVEDAVRSAPTADMHDPSYATDNECWTDAKALVRRGGPFSQEEARILGAASALVFDRPVLDGLDVLTVQVAHNFRSTEPVREHRPTPMDAAIAAADADRAAAAELERAASAAMHDLEHAILRARGAEAERLRDQLRDAKQEWLDRDRDFLRASARANALKMARTRWLVENGL